MALVKIVFFQGDPQNIREEKYSRGETMIWKLCRDEFNSLESEGISEVANLSLDEHELRRYGVRNSENDVNLEYVNGS